MAKLDIFDPVWLEVVFAGRNKAYGAYELRKENSKTTSRALLIGAAIFIVAVASPMIVRLISGIMPEDTDKVIATEVTLTAPPPVDEKTPPPPPPAEPPKPKVDQVKFPPPVVVPAAEVRDQEPPTVEQLKEADPGQKDIKGDPDAEISVDVSPGEGEQMTENNEPVDFSAVEVLPKFEGDWNKYLQRNLKYPPMAQENNISGRVTLQFVVERDGSITDIKVLRGIGGGCDEEAKRVLQKAPKWSPGIQNGRPVRVSYVMPIVFQLSE